MASVRIGPVSLTAQGVSADEMERLRTDFPQFRIWQEVIGDRTRYVARSLHAGIGPHTVVTADLGELRVVLNDAPPRPQASRSLAFDAAVPNIARMYDAWLGGKDNFQADRRAAGTVTAEFPEIVQVARANRQFVIRAVRHVAARGITQFLDLGAGLPASPSVHETARQVAPAARVVYVDNDSVVLAHARALQTGGPNVAVVAGDMRQPEAILASPGLRDLLDLDLPVCVILASVLHFVCAREADAIVAGFTGAMPPGSYLILSAGTCTGTSPALIRRLQAAYQGTAVITGRTEAQIAGYFTGLRLEPPGLVDVWAWRPDGQRHWPPANARIVGAVACKPGSSR